MISLHLNMTQFYIQADGIPQFIVMIEEVDYFPGSVIKYW
jgi:hypothetical protein